MIDNSCYNVNEFSKMQLKVVGNVNLLNFEPIKTVKDFWKFVDIWISKPLFYLKNCGGTELIFLNFMPYFFSPFARKLNEERDKINSYGELKETIKRIEAEICESEGSSHEATKPRYLMVRIAFPKSGGYKPENVELIQCDFKNTRVFIAKVLLPYDKVEEMCCYEIQLMGNIATFYSTPLYVNSDEMRRLYKIFYMKITKWTNNEVEHQQQISSHNLVKTEAYIDLYNRLKKKYAEEVTKIWTESTDPKKAIHQAISIATYLILIWEKEQTYVDLGCGTGLLVHILNNENHKGKGIDVRARQIWSSYPPSTILEVSTITPNDVYPVDWIIGNHSDELTPLIPLIAARSSYKTNFFVLPCCTYNLDGTKYQRSDIEKSQYGCYLDYVESLCEKCGFKVRRDRMKIPSTKRICFVSQGRCFEESEYDENSSKVLSILRSNCQKYDQASDSWVSITKAREAQEKVRNCTQLDRKLIDDIVDKVAQIILKTNSNTSWNEGEFVEMSDIVRNIPSETLSMLKKECGGLQTLLRNHRFIFQVEKGKVKFRKPIERIQRPKNWKQKSCWFFSNHPQSCPLNDDQCSFIHDL